MQATAPFASTVCVAAPSQTLCTPALHLLPRAPPDLLNNRPIGQRAIVISAGVVANIIFAFTVLFTQASCF